MLLATTIPASCLQYYNPSWSLSPSESPSVFIFLPERELSSQPVHGRSCHPPSEGWLFTATGPSSPFSPQHKPAAKDRQSNQGKEPGWEVVLTPGLCWAPQLKTTFSNPFSPKEAGQCSAHLTKCPPKGAACPLLAHQAEYLAFSPHADFTSDRRQCQARPGMLALSAVPSHRAQPPCFSPTLHTAGSCQEVKSGGANSSTH